MMLIVDIFHINLQEINRTSFIPLIPQQSSYFCPFIAIFNVVKHYILSVINLMSYLQACPPPVFEN